MITLGRGRRARHSRRATLAACAVTALALSGALASTASADLRLVSVTGSQTYAAGTFSFSGTALIATTAIPGNPVVPPNPIVPPNPVHVMTSLAALGADVATGTSCGALGVQSTIVSADSPQRLVTSNRIVPSNPVVPGNPVIPGNPIAPDPVCRELDTVTVVYRLALAPDGTITDATATAGPPVT